MRKITAQLRSIGLASLLLLQVIAAVAQGNVSNDYIAYASKETGVWEIRWINPDTGESGVLLVVGGSRIWGGEFSPDRTKFAFSSDMDGDFDIYWISADGTGSVNRITDDSHRHFMPKWIGDEELIFVTGSGYPNYEIEKINLDGSGVECLTCPHSGSFTMPVLAPDRTQIAYTDGYYAYIADFPSFQNRCQLQTQGSVYHMATDWAESNAVAFYTSNQYNIYTTLGCDSGAVDLSPDGADDVTPKFSHDGSWIAFESWIDNTPNIWITRNDGDPLTRQQVTSITQPQAVEILDWGGTYGILHVALDIKPGSCPNPLNVKPYRDTEINSDLDATGDAMARVSPSQRGKGGVLPVAVVGTADFDISDIAVTTVALEGISPLRFKIKDVATPIGPDAEECECNELGPDGIPDLTLKFSRRAIVSALGEIYDGDIIPLTITGELLDGTPFEGTDCVVIKHGAEPPPLTSAFGLINYPNPFNPTTHISFSLHEAGDVRLDIYNVMGQTVATPVDEYLTSGFHEVEWSASSVASGVYFYRLTAGGISETKRMLLLK